MILTVLGGSAHSTPALLDSLGRANSTGVEVRLVGRDPVRLSAVARAGRVLTGRAVAHHGWDDLPSALSGTDAVLIQVRPGGYSGRRFDETFPLSRGVPGDEGLGPGGLSAAWRGWPTLREMLREVRTLAPSAYSVLLTSPGSLVIRLAASEFPGWRLLSVCELPWTTIRKLCGDANSAADATFDYQGVNHLGWLYNVVCEGRDVIREYARDPRPGVFPSAELVARLGAYPLKYLRLHYATADVAREQLVSPGARALELVSIAEDSFRVFATGSAAAIRSALGRRRAEWYDDAVVPMLTGLAGNPCSVPIFATAAEGDDVRERRYRIEGGALIEMRPSQAPSDEVVRTLDRFVDYEEQAAAAVLSRTETQVARALAAHPWVRSRSDANDLAHMIVSQRDETVREGAYA